jgi:hypothetical protein
MTAEKFMTDPWKASHPAYESSPFNIRPAPEFATAEVVVASLYRAVGFEGHRESAVPAAGREFERASSNPRTAAKVGSKIAPETWRTVLHGVLESPKQPNQSSKRFLQLCPVIPDVSLYSGSARLAGNSWNPGLLVQRMIAMGNKSREEARELWARLFAGLTVSEEDDIWARWLQSEFDLRRPRDVVWKAHEMESGADLTIEDKQVCSFPAQQFVGDLNAVLEAKGCMTRRQWISLLEAVLRLGTVTHTLWLCGVNDRLWQSVRGVLSGGTVLDAREIRHSVIQGSGQFLTYGNPAVPLIRDDASRYLSARLGLNLLLWHLESFGEKVGALNSAGDLERLLALASEFRDRLNEAGIRDDHSRLRDEHARTLACKKGIGSNLVEFSRHTLGQRQTASESLRGYDQGYFLRKKGEHSAAPWIVSLGPVAVLALVHCCLHEVAGPRSVQRLCAHLARYGIDVDRDDIGLSDLGHQLRMLGLVLDSPDAESGMLLVPPFELSTKVAAAGGLP